MSASNTISQMSKSLYLTFGKNVSKPLKVGECLMDKFNRESQIQKNVHLNYHRKTGHVNIGQDVISGEGWLTYKNLFFEHSDTCPSRRGRLQFEEKNIAYDPETFDKFIKVAVCSYIMDKNNYLLLTQRPSTLRSFPQAWVVPGGLVDMNERFEKACLREIQEEIGLNIKYDKVLKKHYLQEKLVTQNNESDPEDLADLAITSVKGNKPQNIARDIKVKFEPYYLYESVTKNITGINDHHNEKFPPKSQHLVLFFMARLDQSYQDIHLKFNQDEIQLAAWASLEQLKDSFNELHSDMDGYSNLNEITQPNCKINTKILYPIYRHNSYMQGLGKGHYLALRYLINKNTNYQWYD